MKITRIYTGDDNETHFEELDIPATETEIGLVTGQIPAAAAFFRQSEGGTMDFHVAPRRQFVIHLEGEVEIEVGDGTKRRFGPGDVLLADDTTGHGHISRSVGGRRRQIFVALADDVDIGRWR